MPAKTPAKDQSQQGQITRESLPRKLQNLAAGYDRHVVMAGRASKKKSENAEAISGALISTLAPIMAAIGFVAAATFATGGMGAVLLAGATAGVMAGAAAAGAAAAFKVRARNKNPKTWDPKGQLEGFALACENSEELQAIKYTGKGIRTDRNSSDPILRAAISSLSRQRDTKGQGNQNGMEDGNTQPAQPARTGRAGQAGQRDQTLQI